MADRGAVLVTGGAGYIGSHCCKALAEAGYRPVCFDNFSTGHRSFVKWGPVITGDVRDPSQLQAVFQSYDFSAVMHFAASSSVGESVTDPQKYYANNVGGTLALLNAMRRVGQRAAGVFPHGRGLRKCRIGSYFGKRAPVSGQSLWQVEVDD
jgi:UDP-glucose 4-epimerase